MVAGALPLLYGMAEGIIAGVTPTAPPPEVPEVARPGVRYPPFPAAGRLGYDPELSGT